MNASVSNSPYEYAGAGQRRYTGIIVVVLLHVLIVYGLVSGLARKAVEIIKKPIEMKIMEEVKLPPPPPPPPPPKIEKIKDVPPPPEVAPPPPYVPPPEVQVIPPPVAAPVIQAVAQEPPPKPVEIKPPPPPAPPAPPAPPPPAPPPPVKAEIGLACPGYKEILANSLAGQFDRFGVTGVVKVMIKIQGRQIVDVTPQSGPREYYRAVQGAVKRMNCATTGATELLVPLEVSFREE
ncbi:MAG: energy transducer TonB [Burkholderiales bacterium]|nr:energy transducer TonB [Burkholderiales bacterium]